MSDMWQPHVTVACVIERDGRYLLVEERDKQTAERVLNQPAGHLEPGETLLEAARRETLEETCWQVKPIGVIGLGLYTVPGTYHTYCRTTFLAEPVEEVNNGVRDSDILAVHWMDYATLQADSAKLRSPLVLETILRHRRGICYPLDLIHTL
ncbi:MAG: NUDIX hydrolase [Pseudomonadota bacterium]